MWANKIRTGILWWPYVLALCAACLVAVIYGYLREDSLIWGRWIPDRIQLANIRSGALTWKQPILPAQFAQASCGGCHQKDLSQTPRLNHGRQLLVKFNCIACHQLQDIDRPAMLGPDLTSIGTKVSREWIYKWLRDPRTVTDASGNITVDGVATEPRMPKFQLTDLELRALSAYLSSQHAKPITPYRIKASLGAKPDDAADQGQIRFNQMFCVTCHALAVERGGETKLIGGDIGPELTKVGSKVKPEWLIGWLRDPEGYLQHTKMPQYQWSDKDLLVVSQFIMRRLTDPDLLKDVPQLGAPTDVEVRLGQRLFIEKGCAECHVIQGVTPQSNFAPNLSALGMAAGPYNLEVKSARDLPARLHFIKTNREPLEITESIVPRAMITYVQAKITNPKSVTPEAHMPSFHMSQSDLDDLTTALLSMTGPPPSNSVQNHLIIARSHTEFHPDGRAAQLYQRYKCYECHTFKGYGGSLAPDLSFEGSRSKREWLVDFLKNPQTLRPTLTVRMPRFNMSNEDATELAGFITGTLLSSEVVTSTVSEATLTSAMADHGKQLYETKYGCQSCHTIGFSGGYVGPSLNNAGNWLTPSWIEAWLRNPQALVPGAIEPRHSFSEDEIRDITAYLLTLKQAPTVAVAATSTGGQQ